jgi:hypothetical protein
LGRIRDKGEPILQIYLAMALPVRGTLILRYEFSGVHTHTHTRTTHEASNSRRSPAVSFSPTGSGTSAVYLTVYGSCPLRGMRRHDEQWATVGVRLPAPDSGHDDPTMPEEHKP